MKLYVSSILLMAAWLSLSAAIRPQLGSGTRPLIEGEWGTVLDFAAAQRDLRISHSLFSRFPYLQSLLSDPAFSGTVFLATDKAWCRELKQGSTHAALGHLTQQLEAALNPGVISRESIAWRWFWRALNAHIVPAQPLDSLVAGAAYSTALAAGDMLSVARNVSQALVRTELAQAAVLSSARAGRAVVHVVDGVLLPSVPPPESFPGLGDVLGSALAKALPSSSLLAGPWPRLREPAITLFAPTLQAFEEYFARNREAGHGPASMEALLADPTALQAWVEAHVVPGRRLWLWDLQSLASLGSPSRQLALLSGQEAGLTRPQGSLAEVELVVEGVSHRVLPFVGADVGGSPWGCVPGSMGTCADAHAVVHSIDRVIVKQEASPVTSSSSSSSSS